MEGLLKMSTCTGIDSPRMGTTSFFSVIWCSILSVIALLSIVWLDCTLRGIDSFLRMATTSFFSVIWCSILSVIVLLSMEIALLFWVWLKFTLRGIDSFLGMGTTTFLSVIWCSILSVIAMTGMTKFLMILAIAALMGFFAGFTRAILVIAISGIVVLWFYGSFWTTALVIFFGGLAFTFSQDRLALFITTVYSVYCAWTYVGWFGLLVGLNLSFISSDAPKLSFNKVVRVCSTLEKVLTAKKLLKRRRKSLQKRLQKRFENFQKHISKSI